MTLPEIDSALDDLINLDKELTAPALDEEVAGTHNKLFKHDIEDQIGKYLRPANIHLKPHFLKPRKTVVASRGRIRAGSPS